MVTSQIANEYHVVNTGYWQLYWYWRISKCSQLEWKLKFHVIFSMTSLFPFSEKLAPNCLILRYFNPNLGGLFKGSIWGGWAWAGLGGGKITPPPSLRLKLVIILREIQLWHVSTHTCVVSENISFNTRTLLILLMSAFFCKKSSFFGQSSTFTQSNSVRVVLEIF